MVISCAWPHLWLHSLCSQFISPRDWEPSLYQDHPFCSWKTLVPFLPPKITEKMSLFDSSHYFSMQWENFFYLTSSSDAATFMQGVPFPSSYEAWAKSYFSHLMWTWTLKSKHPLTYLPDTAGWHWPLWFSVLQLLAVPFLSYKFSFAFKRMVYVRQHLCL